MITESGKVTGISTRARNGLLSRHYCSAQNAQLKAKPTNRIYKPAHRICVNLCYVVSLNVQDVKAGVPHDVILTLDSRCLHCGLWID